MTPNYIFHEDCAEFLAIAANRLRKLDQNLPWLAKYMRMSSIHVRMVFHAGKVPSYDFLLRLSEVLGLEWEYQDLPDKLGSSEKPVKPAFIYPLREVPSPASEEGE